MAESPKSELSGTSSSSSWCKTMSVLLVRCKSEVCSFLGPNNLQNTASAWCYPCHTYPSIIVPRLHTWRGFPTIWFPVNQPGQVLNDPITVIYWRKEHPLSQAATRFTVSSRCGDVGLHKMGDQKSSFKKRNTIGYSHVETTHVAFWLYGLRIARDGAAFLLRHAAVQHVVFAEI